jgi:hypothetical protein
MLALFEVVAQVTQSMDSYMNVTQSQQRLAIVSIASEAELSSKEIGLQNLRLGFRRFRCVSDYSLQRSVG